MAKNKGITSPALAENVEWVVFQSTELFQVSAKGLWPGVLYLSPHPCGGDLLRQEMEKWRTQNINVVISLLTQDEERMLSLQNERHQLGDFDIRFISFPILGRKMPTATDLEALLRQIREQLDSGNRVVLHSKQSVGRTGLVAACLLVRSGMQPENALNLLAASRRAKMPETPEKVKFIREFWK